MIRLGLCCVFRCEPIKFRQVTLAYLNRLKKPYDHLCEVIIANVSALKQSLEYCAAHAIGCFRINSQLFPAFSHPDWSYAIENLPHGGKILELLEECRTLRFEKGLRLTLHPDQFIVLNSPKKEVTKRAISELDYHALLSDFLEIDVINIHGGGVYGDKKRALARFKAHYAFLSEQVKKRLTVENDDTSYTPLDLLPLCHELGMPLVYDVHHHRCHQDSLPIQMATQQAVKTWNREPLFHISSPLEGWEGPKPGRHHDFISPSDFPSVWNNLTLTVEVEAKAKELAVSQLRDHLEAQGVCLWSCTAANS